MNPYCSESGIRREDIETALHALSLSKTEYVPVLAIKTNGRGDRVVFASEPMLALFRATDLNEITARLFDSADPGAKRLAELARNLPNESGPRLERLRFFFGPVVETVTFLCRKYEIGQQGPLLIAAALGARLPRQAPAASAAPSETAESAASAALSLDEVRKALLARMGDAKSARFLWRTDANDKITEITPPLADVVGTAAADLLGRDFGDVAKYLDREPEGPLARAIAKRETFSGIEVLWPIARAAAAVPVSLGALPAFTAERRFDGYRGFGVIRLDRVTAAEPRAFITEASDPSPAAEASVADAAAAPLAHNVVPLRPLPKAAVEKPSFIESMSRKSGPLSDEEETAFREIAAALAEEAAKEGEAKPAQGAPASSATLASIAAGLGRNAPQIFNRLGFGILISRDDVPIYANRYLLDFLGFADEDALYAAGGMAQVFAQIRSGGEAVGVRTASGGVAPVRGRLQTIDWDGLPATLLTLLPTAGETRDLDIAALRSEAAGLAAILDTAADGVVFLDAEGKILSINRSGEALFGYGQKDLVGEPFSMLVSPDSRAKLHLYFEAVKTKAAGSLTTEGREVVGQARQGGTLPLFLTLGRIGTAGQEKPQDKSKEKYCAVLRDMTQSKKIERDLDTARRDAERASALKSDFLAKVSHEVRTPLNAIIGFAEVMIEERLGPVGTERYKDYLKDIHASGTHVLSLVNDLLDLSKIEAGKMDLDIVAVDPNRVISECVGIMQPQANQARVIMRLSLAAHLPKILADERSVRQIVLNLLSNAVKFNEPGGQVIVSTAATDDGCAVIRIKDTGIGMSDADLETALEPFRQVAGAKQSGGTGLGLPLTKALVEANGAAFSIKSKKNEGTLVEVAFPPARLVRDPLTA